MESSSPSVERLAARSSTDGDNGATPSSSGVPQAVLDEVTARRERAIVWVTSVGHFLCHLAEVMFPCLLLAVCAEFSLARDEGTFVALLGYVLFGAGALPVGLWADRWGTRNLFCGYFFLVAGSAVAVALAPSTLGLFLALTALGLAASIYHPAGLSMISLGVARRSRAMGMNGVAGNLGIASAPLVAWLAMAGLGDWRWAYVILAVLALSGGTMMVGAMRRGLLDTLSRSPSRADFNAAGGASPRPSSCRP